MNKTIVGVIIVLVIGGGAYYVIANKNSSGSAGQTPSAETQAILVSDTAVSIKNFSFNPSTLTVKTGTTVTWTNNDSVSHTVTSDSGGLLNSPTLAPGQSFSFTFTSPGSVSYHCAIHPMMKGTVSIKN